MLCFLNILPFNYRYSSNRKKKPMYPQLIALVQLIWLDHVAMLLEPCTNWLIIKHWDIKLFQRILPEQAKSRHSMNEEEWKFRAKQCRTLKTEGTLESLQQVVAFHRTFHIIYNPIRGQNINFQSEHVDSSEAAVPNMLMLPALQANDYPPLVETKRVCFKLPAKARPRIYFNVHDGS